MPNNPSPNQNPNRSTPSTPVEAPQRTTPDKVEIDPMAKNAGKRHDSDCGC